MITISKFHHLCRNLWRVYIYKIIIAYKEMEIHVVKWTHVFSGYKSLFVRPGHIWRYICDCFIRVVILCDCSVRISQFLMKLCNLSGLMLITWSLISFRWASFSFTLTIPPEGLQILCIYPSYHCSYIQLLVSILQWATTLLTLRECYLTDSATFLAEWNLSLIVTPCHTAGGTTLDYAFKDSFKAKSQSKVNSTWILQWDILSYR